MDDSLPVRGVEGLGDLRAILQHLRQRQRATGQRVGQRFAVDQLHHQVVAALLLADVEQRADVGMAQRGDRLRLAPEAGEQRGVGGEVGRQHLDRHLAVEARVPGAVDLAHSAGADRRGDLVRTEPGAGIKCHGTVEGTRGRGHCVGTWTSSMDAGRPFGG